MIVSASDLTIGYRHGSEERVVQRGLTLALQRGSLTCLLGENGAGKSTLLRTLSGELPRLSGTLTIDGTDPERCSPTRLARLVSLVGTERTAVADLTVAEVVAIGRQPYTGFFGRLDREDKAIVADSIDAVGISQLATRKMMTLSDGERQKVMIARAVAQRTPLMMLDEPTSFLDAASRLEVMALLQSLARHMNIAVLLSTHDVAEALGVATDAWLMTRSGGVITGPVADIIGSGAMDSLFPGRGVTFDPNTCQFRR